MAARFRCTICGTTTSGINDDRYTCPVCGTAWLYVDGWPPPHPQVGTFESVRARQAAVADDNTPPSIAPPRGDLR
jgi:transposase